MSFRLELKSLFSTWKGVVLAGAAIGGVAPLLQKLGNPGNMGICVACFERDSIGALGFHRAAVVQYLRPEIPALLLGALIAAFLFGEFRPRGGSAPVVRLLLGIFAMIGSLVFLGCPWRCLLRLAGGDGNALFGLAGLICGIWIGTVFFRLGYSLGRSRGTYFSAGLVMPLLFLGLLALRILCPAPGQEETAEALGKGVKSLKSGLLFYSIAGPGKMHAPVILSVLAGLVLGAVAQRSRFCTMGAFRDLILFRQPHLVWGVLALVATAVVVNLLLGQFKPGFSGQPAAHNMWVWNFASMVLAGLCFALAGGCPGRQLFMTGEGDGDAAIFVVGMILGAAVAHNFGLAATPKGVSTAGMVAVLVGLVVCVGIGLSMREKA